MKLHLIQRISIYTQSYTRIAEEGREQAVCSSGQPWPLVQWKRNAGQGFRTRHVAKSVRQVTCGKGQTCQLHALLLAIVQRKPTLEFLPK